MLRKCCVLGFVLLAFFSSKSYASGDYGCGAPRGTVLFRSYQTCNSLPFLSPSNDSRLNLELLLIDAGKLTGSLNTVQAYPPPRDLAWLAVPFDLENWQLHDPSLGATTNAASANSPANSSDYAQGEGSRCNSAGEGLDAFKKAVGAATALPKEEASILIAARSALVVGCSATTKPGWNPPQGIRSALGHEFSNYVAGANAFYAGDFPAALSSFKSLQNSTDPWLKETSRYMVGRTSLNSAPQGAFGEWGELKLDATNKADLKAAEEAFNSYLRDFPRGSYAVSARGLLRRVYWLNGDQTHLAEAFDRALADSDKRANNVSVSELIQEADSKLIASVKMDQIQSPQFLAIIDLMRMRTGDEQAANSTAKVSLSLSDLEAQKNRFASNPALYQYLLAAYHVFVDNKPEQALAILPSPSHASLNYFAFSQQTLRLLALDSGNQFDKERTLLLQLLPLAKSPLQSEQLQLELAMLDARSAHIDRAFAPGSPVQDKAIRTILVEYSASADMLRQRIKDPQESADVVEAALYTLLYKELTGGKYQAFQADLSLMPAHPSEFLAPFAAAGTTTDYHCPSLRQAASILQQNAGDAQSLNCIGELLRVHSVHYGQDAAPPATDLGGSASLFPVTNYSRMDGYLKVIADKQAQPDARAYALFRAVRCYAPSGYNDCGKQDIPQGTRKQWFQMLHSEYPASIWAKSSKLYW